MKRVYEKIFSQCPAADFVGRDAEVAAILSLAQDEIPPKALVILSAPRAGASELLRQVYDRLFLEQTEKSPFYFCLKASDENAQNAASRFAYEFLLQTVAFRRRDRGIVSSSPGLTEIAELAAPADIEWMDRIIESARSGRTGPSFIRELLSGPQRAAANGGRLFVMIDDLHVTQSLADGAEFLNILLDIFSRSLCPVVISGLRRFLFGRLQADIIDLDVFPVAEAGALIEKYAARSGVEVNDQSRDLVAVQLAGNAGHIAALIDAAATNGADLTSFDEVERIYTNEIFGGLIGKYYDDILARAGDGVLGLLAESLDAPDGRLPRAYWNRHSGTANIESLHNYEIVNAGSGTVSVDFDNSVLGDYIRARTHLELRRGPRALTVGNALSRHLQRAPHLMARSYRRTAAIDLKELLESFDGRQVSPVLLDYERFRNELKGADDEKLRKALKDDNQRLRLPQIAFAAHAAAYYPPLRELCDVERAAIGVGFLDGARRNETAWLVAEIDSKLEAKRDLADLWCDRLETAAVACGFSQFTIWLIAPEGFAPDAIEALRERNAYGSSRRQVELLAETIDPERRPPAPHAGTVYEFDISMGRDGELSTARTVEDIGRRHNFPAKAINQIRTALIEACINAAEHSLSPDGNIHQRFVVEADKVTITVSNRGVRLVDRAVPAPAGEERRGWGIKLMKGLMDRMEIEETDDGTRITMVKLLVSEK